MRNHQGRRITIDNLGKLFCDAYMKSATPSIAVPGFKNAVIWSPNANFIPENKLIACNNEHLQSQMQL